MAKYFVTHACGCTDAHQVYGPVRDRDAKVERLQGQPCSACALRERQEEHASSTAVAAAQATAEGLAPLAGTERQVAWAETLRRKVLDELAPRLAQLERGTVAGVAAGTIEPAKAEAARAAGADLLARLRQQTDASWWIEQRHVSAQTMLATRLRDVLEAA